MTSGYVNVPNDFLEKISEEFGKISDFSGSVVIPTTREMLEFRTASSDKIPVLNHHINFGIGASSFLNVIMNRIDETYQVELRYGGYVAYFEFQYEITYHPETGLDTYDNIKASYEIS